MKLSLPFWGPNLTDPAQRSACSCRFIPVVIFMCLAFSVGRPYILDYKQRLSSAWGTNNSIQIAGSSLCKGQYKPLGSENLPEGIISRTSNLELQPLFGSIDSPISQGHAKEPRSLLAIAAGIKQKNVVDLIVQKFFSSNFTIMLFHYDGAVDGWRDLNWSDSALHVSAINQTKWWFAKRFLHPDIVAVYDYIFLWDEDLGVEHFNPGQYDIFVDGWILLALSDSSKKTILRYISIIEKERLMISQPALDTSKSVAHYQITGRLRKGNVHRRVYKYSGGLRCYGNSTAPPCTGWVEMMAPVFSRVAWRCVWHMIQNDLIHAWGLDKKLGYCAQGDRTKNVGVVDSEYIVHLGIPTLGGSVKDGVSVEKKNDSQSETMNSRVAAPPASFDRAAIRFRSFTESDIFTWRWKRAAAADKCWMDPYPEPKREY